MIGPAEVRANPLESREDVRRVLISLCDPMKGRLSRGRARIDLGRASAIYPRPSQEMEGLCRLLWGLAPLLADGPRTTWHDDLIEALVNGTNPAHPEYWGTPGDDDQRLVESAAIAYALLVAPGVFVQPLTRAQRAAVAAYLSIINTVHVRDNNWLLFRVLVNVALRHLDCRTSPSAVDEPLDRLDTFYKGDGWYTDGASPQSDYYVAFAIHFYCLLYAVFAKDTDPVRAQRFRSRAGEFAHQFIFWFAPDGSAIPYGRSLTYRFAQAAFWAALAYSGVDEGSTGAIKGVLLRNLRWWLRLPILSDTGILTIGYGYPSQAVAENYTSPASPYWALKSFLVLALPEGSRFWTAAEEPCPTMNPESFQPHARAIVCRHRGHVFALTGGAAPLSPHRNAAEKYAKFCYSSRFGFSIPSGQRSLGSGAYDSTLALSVDRGYYRVRERSEDARLDGIALVATWEPWDDVLVMTWLLPLDPWHVRIHAIRAPRRLASAEGGFALPVGDDEPMTRVGDAARAGAAGVTSAEGVSLVVDLRNDGRRADLVVADTNTNILHRRTVIPTLVGVLDEGCHWLACAVTAGDRCVSIADLVKDAPRFDVRGDRLAVLDAAGRECFVSSAPAWFPRLA